MPKLSFRAACFQLLALTCVGLAGCSSLGGTGDRVASAVKPYKMDVIQGNVVTREQLAVLKPGMQRVQVRDVLGTPLLTSVFHEDRWDYVFTLQRPGAEPQSRRVTAFFKDDVLERVEADELPSESEFVATLKSKPVEGPLPALEASGERLQKFPVETPPAPAPVAPPAAAVNYPPLEPAGQ